MRLIFVLAASALAAPAFAADAPVAEAPAGPPVCTTVTTVVKRGEVVLSTNSTTKCEEPSRPGGGINLHPGAVLAAPEAVLAAPAAVFGSMSLGGDGDALKLKNTAGDWRVIYDRSGDICHLTLSARTNQSGFLAHGQGCKGELGHAGAWVFHEGATEILTADGKLIVRLTGTRNEVAGQTADGDAVTLQR